MKTITPLYFAIVPFLGGCVYPMALFQKRADVDPAVARSDYILRLSEPIASAEPVLFLDGGSGGLELHDSDGKVAIVIWDWSGSNQSAFRIARRTWHGRRMGEIVLGSIENGRPLDLGSFEATKLLRILEDLDARGLVQPDDIRNSIDDLKRKIDRAQPDSSANDG